METSKIVCISHRIGSLPMIALIVLIGILFSAGCGDSSDDAERSATGPPNATRLPPEN